jgi:hypothetical protein
LGPIAKIVFVRLNVGEGGRGGGRSRIIGIAWISIKELLFKWIFTNYSKKPVISYASASLSYFVLAECVVQNIPF